MRKQAQRKEVNFFFQVHRIGYIRYGLWLFGGWGSLLRMTGLGKWSGAGVCVNSTSDMRLAKREGLEHERCREGVSSLSVEGFEVHIVFASTQLCCFTWKQPWKLVINEHGCVPIKHHIRTLQFEFLKNVKSQCIILLLPFFSYLRISIYS